MTGSRAWASGGPRRGRLQALLAAAGSFLLDPPDAVERSGPGDSADPGGLRDASTPIRLPSGDAAGDRSLRPGGRVWIDGGVTRGRVGAGRPRRERHRGGGMRGAAGRAPARHEGRGPARACARGPARRCACARPALPGARARAELAGRCPARSCAARDRRRIVVAGRRPGVHRRSDADRHDAGRRADARAGCDRVRGAGGARTDARREPRASSGRATRGAWPDRRARGSVRASGIAPRCPARARRSRAARWPRTSGCTARRLDGREVPEAAPTAGCR